MDRRTTLSSTAGNLFHEFIETLEEFKNLESNINRTLIIDNYTSILVNCNSKERAIIRTNIEHLISISNSQKKSIWILAMSSVTKNINLSISIVSMCDRYLIADETTSGWFNREWQQLNTDICMLDYLELMEMAYQCSKQSKDNQSFYSTRNNQWQPL